MEYQIQLKGYVGGVDFDANYVDYMLNNICKDKHVDVLISSTGGSLDTALKIAHAFRAHGDVTAHFVGFNASAATIAAMGAKHITMDSCAFYLVHQCSQEIFLWDSMNKEQLQNLKDNIEQTIENLSTIDEQVAALYAARTCKEVDDLKTLMKKGGWLSAQDALKWGFIDEIKEAEFEPQQLSASEIAAMVKNGIPEPPKTKNSFIKSIVEEIKNFLKPNKKNINMKFICQLLNIDALNADENNVTISNEQAQVIEDYIMQHETAQELNNEPEPVNEPQQANEPETNETTEESTVEDNAIQVINNGTSNKVENNYIKTRKNAQELYNLLT